MVTMVISELKSISRLKIFRETEPWSMTTVMVPVMVDFSVNK